MDHRAGLLMNTWRDGSIWRATRRVTRRPGAAGSMISNGTTGRDWAALSSRAARSLRSELRSEAAQATARAISSGHHHQSPCSKE